MTAATIDRELNDDRPGHWQAPVFDPRTTRTSCPRCGSGALATIEAGQACTVCRWSSIRVHHFAGPKRHRRRRQQRARR